MVRLAMLPLPDFKSRFMQAYEELLRRDESSWPAFAEYITDNMISVALIKQITAVYGDSGSDMPTATKEQLSIANSLADFVTSGPHQDMFGRPFKDLVRAAAVYSSLLSNDKPRRLSFILGNIALVKMRTRPFLLSPSSPPPRHHRAQKEGAQEAKSGLSSAAMSLDRMPHICPPKG